MLIILPDELTIVTISTAISFQLSMTCRESCDEWTAAMGRGGIKREGRLADRLKVIDLSRVPVSSTRCPAVLVPKLGPLVQGSGGWEQEERRVSWYLVRR